MSKKVIDVSSYQGAVDWKKVKAAGIQGAILKIIRKDLNPDKQFEANWAGCEAAGMPVVGVYNYSYATSIERPGAMRRRLLTRWRDGPQRYGWTWKTPALEGLEKSSLTLFWHIRQ